MNRSGEFGTREPGEQQCETAEYGLTHKSTPLLDVPKDDLVTHMDGFKKSFLAKLIFSILSFFIIFFQVFFYSYFHTEENKLIVDIQTTILDDEVSQLMRVLSYAIQPFYIHLLTLHVGFSIYYGMDPILGIKFCLNNLLIFAVNKLVLLFHQEPRPFWLNPEHHNLKVDGYGCVTSFSNPDMSVIQLLVSSVNLLLLESQLRKVRSRLSIPNYLIYGGFFLALLVFMVLYLGGEVFLSQFVISSLYTFLYYQLLVVLNPLLSSGIRMCTVDAPMHFNTQVNSVMVFLIAMVAEVFILIGYNSKNLTPKIISNYVDCFHQMRCVEKFKPFLLENHAKFNPEQMGTL